MSFNYYNIPLAKPSLEYASQNNITTIIETLQTETFKPPSTNTKNVKE
jgi:hypothetical protein